MERSGIQDLPRHPLRSIRATDIGFLHALHGQKISETFKTMKDVEGMKGKEGRQYLWLHPFHYFNSQYIQTGL
jgi:hypothetical protein